MDLFTEAIYTCESLFAGEEMTEDQLQELQNKEQENTLLGKRVAEEANIREFNEQKKQLLGIGNEVAVNPAALENHDEVPTKDGKGEDNPTKPR